MQYSCIKSSIHYRTVKMPTEAANCSSGSVIVSKSRRDVEAAYAILQLSEQQPRGTDCEVRTNGYGSAMTGSPPRFSHVRTVVMSHTSSRVEKTTVKRKFDWPDADRRRERSSLVSAYYNLGQSAAAAASQLLLVKPIRSNLSVSVHSTQLTTDCPPHQQRRCVDSSTLRKVRRGEFGALSTLRLYCSQLRRHSDPTSNSSGAVKDSTNDEIAMDLSVRKHTKQFVVSDGWYRSSRNRGCSPSVRLNELAD